MRLAFFGTPAFALPTLDALCTAGLEPLLVVSQPGRPAGRGRTVTQPPVAAWAELHQLELAQPKRVGEPELLQRVESLDLDLAVVVAFGQIFPAELLGLPRRGCVNVHASLLPRHRGAAPVQAAILAGDGETGVTTMLMDEGLDTGPTLLSVATRLHGRETAGTLSARLAHLGAGALLETLEGLAAGRLAPRPQPASGATYAPRVTSEDGRARWEATADELDAQRRAMTPWPGLHTELRDERIKLLAGEVLAGRTTDRPPGTILGIEDGRLGVACGGGGVFGVSRLQRPGRSAVSALDFANGVRLEEEERFD